MALSLVTPPAVEPVTLAEAKAHLRVGLTDDDATITGLIVSAREYVETFTHRALIAQTWDDKRGGFPCAGEAIWLPKPPLLIATPPVITYVDTNGVTQTWSSTLYTVDAPAGPKARAACILPNYGQSYPATRDVVNAVTIRFVAGYGAAAAVPSMIKTCLMEHVRAAELRGDADAALKILEWVGTQLWGYKAF